MRPTTKAKVTSLGLREQLRELFHLQNSEDVRGDGTWWGSQIVIT